MIAVGIDVSKGKSTVAILNGDGSIRAHPYEMNHSKAELDALIKYIKAVDDHPIILMEPTSHYHYPVLKAFLDAGLSPSTYQSGQLTSSYAHMEKRGSRYLRYALFNAAIYVCHWDPTFKAYLAKKRTEGKHYYVAVSHACKKLVRVIYRMQLTGEAYRAA